MSIIDMHEWVHGISFSFTKSQAKQDLATAIREEKQASEA